MLPWQLQFELELFSSHLSVTLFFHDGSALYFLWYKGKAVYLWWWSMVAWLPPHCHGRSCTLGMTNFPGSAHMSWVVCASATWLWGSAPWRVADSLCYQCTSRSRCSGTLLPAVINPHFMMDDVFSIIQSPYTLLACNGAFTPAKILPECLSILCLWSSAPVCPPSYWFPDLCYPHLICLY